MNIVDTTSNFESPLSAALEEPHFRFQEIHLEITTACNFRCGFCPLGELGRPAARMSFEMAADVLNQCVDDKLARNATFHLMGEALLHPDCMRILRHCQTLGIRTRLVSNGSLYRPEQFTELFALLDRLDISFRTVDDMEVQAVHKKLTFQQYIDKVMASIMLRAETPHSKTSIRIRAFISPKTIPSLRELCGRLGVDPEAVIGGSRTRLEQYQSFAVYPWLSFLCERELDWLGDTKQYPSHFGNCNEYEIGFAVLASGDVTTCCWDAHGGNVMGNVRDARLKDVLFSEASESFRSSFRKHRCPTETCQKCLGRQSLPKSIAYQALSIANLR